MAARARRAMARFETEHRSRSRNSSSSARSPRAGRRRSGHAPGHRPARRPWGTWSAGPALRAELLAGSATKYGLPAPRVTCGSPRRRRPAVAEEYRAADEVSLRGSGPRRSSRERMRWLRDAVSRRLESLPPFWLAFTLTLTETVGVGVLALPIAFAGFGAAGATSCWSSSAC